MGPLDLDLIRGTLASRGRSDPLVYRPRLGSTNEFALKLLSRDMPDGTLVIAEEQTRGRGRRGRVWLSPSELGLYLSLLLRPRLDPPALPLLTFAAAVGICRALRRYLSQPVQIKWPNDLWVQGRKVGGILAETRGAQESLGVVVGVGLNVNHQEEDFPDQLRLHATSLRIMGGRVLDRNQILLDLLQSWEEQNRILMKEGPAELLREWERHSFLKPGVRIRIDLDGEAKTGEYRGVGKQGELLFRGQGKRVIPITFGEAHLVREADSCCS